MRVKTDMCLLDLSFQFLNVINTFFLIWIDLRVGVFTDNNSEAAVEEAMALFDECQADFRSILSFGVQEP